MTPTRYAEACEEGADTVIAEAAASACKDCTHPQCLRLARDANALSLTLRALAKALREAVEESGIAYTYNEQLGCTVVANWCRPTGRIIITLPTEPGA